MPTNPNGRDYSLVGRDACIAIESGLASAEWYHTDVPRKVMKELMQRSDGPALRDAVIWFAVCRCHPRCVVEAGGRLRHRPIDRCASDSGGPKSCHRTRRPPPGCIHHSDRGSQYAAELYCEALTANGLVGSMGRRGNPYDNARLRAS